MDPPATLRPIRTTPVVPFRPGRNNESTMSITEKIPLKLNPWVLFLGLTLSVSALAAFLAHTPHPYPVDVAICLDLALTIPAAWYLLMVRTGLRSAATVPLIAMIGLWRASLLFPSIVPGKLWIGAGLEVALLGTLIMGLRAARLASAAFDDADPVDRLRAAVTHLFSPQTMNRSDSLPAKAMATEFSVFYYAFGWKLKPHIPPASRAFTLHERSGANVLIGCLAAISLLEITPVHLLLNHWFPAKPFIAWIATGLSLWGAVWMLALCRAFALRPTVVAPDSITVRFGLLFRVKIPAASIATLEYINAPDGVRVVPKATPASVYIRFREPLNAEFPGGFTRPIEAIGLSADDDLSFREAISQLIGTDLLQP